MRVSAKIQFIVGLFVIFTIGCFVYMSGKIAFKLASGNNSYYQVAATFSNINGLKTNAQVKIGGLPIGYVYKLDLDPKTLEPVAYIYIENKYNDLPENSTLAVKTNGILGDKFLDFQVGFVDEELGVGGYLHDGSVIVNTSSAVDLEDIISNFAFGDKKE